MHRLVLFACLGLFGAAGVASAQGLTLLTPEPRVGETAMLAVDIPEGECLAFYKYFPSGSGGQQDFDTSLCSFAGQTAGSVVAVGPFETPGVFTADLRSAEPPLTFSVLPARPLSEIGRLTTDPDVPIAGGSVLFRFDHPFSGEARRATVASVVPPLGDTPGEILIQWSLDTDLLDPGERLLASAVTVDSLPAGTYRVSTVRQQSGVLTPPPSPVFVTELEVATPAAEAFLLDGRFRTSVTWTDYDGNTGVGLAVPNATDQSVLFTFFATDNWEVTLKMVDACSFNDRFWVFLSAATDVQYTVTVEDTVTGETSTYQNALGVASAATTDTQAFATCSASAGGDA